MLANERLLNNDIIPSKELIFNTIGEKNIVLWRVLNEYLQLAYDIQPEMLFYGKKYGWCYKYRKSNRTLCILFPEKGSFTVLINLGTRDLENLKKNYENLTFYTQKLIKETQLYRDGKRLWIRMPERGSIDDVKKLTALKRKPKENK